MRLLLVFLLGVCVASSASQFSTVCKWRFPEVDFVWPSEASRDDALADGTFKPEQIHPERIAVHKDRLFLGIVKLKGVPVTLASIPNRNSKGLPAPRLAPFPNWQFHKSDKCSGIKEARGMDVDSEGRLWVADVGSEKCAAKLWIFDLESNDTVYHVHRFADTEVSSSFRHRWLRDMVLDETPDDLVAYVTDGYQEHIIAFSDKRKLSWCVKTPGKRFSSLALSPRDEGRQLYLQKYYSQELFSLPVRELRSNSSRNAALKLVGSWSARPYRMLIDDADLLYAALSVQNSISTWNTTTPFRERRFYQVGPSATEWPLIISLDANGTLWVMEVSHTAIETRLKLSKTARPLATPAYKD